MNRAQKIAWFNLITIATGLIFIGAFLIATDGSGISQHLAKLGVVVICSLTVIAHAFLQKAMYQGERYFDERDKLIQKKATFAGFATSYLFVGLACMLPFFILGPNGSISVKWLAYVFVGAGISSLFAHSVAILVQYGWGVKEKNHE